MRLRSVLELLGLGSIAGLFTLWSIGAMSIYRFRLTIVIDTPSGSRCGAAVYEVRTRWALSLSPGGKGPFWRVFGEAVAIDLEGGETIFALLKTVGTQGDLAESSMRSLDPAYRNDIVESGRRLAGRRNVEASAEVAPAYYPKMVRFRDRQDPSSIELMDAADISTVLGRGHTVKSVMVDLTKAPVTTGIAKRLPWLKRYNPRAHKRFRVNGLPLGDFKGLFSTEL